MPLYVTILYFTTSFLLMAVGFLLFLKDRKSLAIQSLFLCAIMMTLFILSIYAGYFFVNPSAPKLSTFFIRITFAFGIFVSFSLCTFSYYYPRQIKKYSSKLKMLFFFMTFLTAFVSSFTPLVYQSEVFFGGNLVADIHGPLHNFYILHFLFNSGLAIWIAVDKIKNLKGIEKDKTMFSSIGTTIALLPIILFYAILPKFGIYLFQIEAALFSVCISSFRNLTEQ